MNSEEVIKTMEGWFCSAGLPRCVRSDGGPQFRSAYSNWLASLGVVQETSSPYNSSSNGLAEKAVKDIKSILKRQEGRYDISKLPAEYNSVARAGMDASPADLFFNRAVRSTTPGSGRRNLDLERAQQKQIEEQHTIRRKLGRGRLSLEVFKKGNRVRVQDIRNKTWTKKGTVTSEVFHKGPDPIFLLPST